ncbi:MAG: hypothetical protein U0798_04685 [Gemmataceae bacterium]
MDYSKLRLPSQTRRAQLDGDIVTVEVTAFAVEQLTDVTYSSNCPRSAKSASCEEFGVIESRQIHIVLVCPGRGGRSKRTRLPRRIRPSSMPTRLGRVDGEIRHAGANLEPPAHGERRTGARQAAATSFAKMAGNEAAFPFEKSVVFHAL